MKQIQTLAAVLLGTALLCAGCGRSADTPEASGVNRPPAEVSVTPAPGTAQQPADTPAVDETPRDDRAAYGAYLDVLAANREGILGYDWQKGMVFDADTYETRPADVTAPVALADVWGDETPELLFLAAEDYEGFRYTAKLHVYTFENGGARELIVSEDKTLDGQVGGGMNYRLFQTGEDKGLWLYECWYSEGMEETYAHYAAEGAMEPRLVCTYSVFPVEDASQMNGWGKEETWKKQDAECTRAEYEAAVPTLSEQADGLLMRNAEYYEYNDDFEVPDDLFRFPQGTAMTYDDAAAYLRGEAGVSVDEAVDEAAFFASLPGDFAFLSGVGGWSSGLTLAPNGTFVGTYHDSDMGDMGEGYPDGTIYVCSFSGRFGEVRRVDDYTYSMRLLELKTDPTPAEEWIEDGVRYVSSAPYGLENASEVMVYLPGAWLRALPQEFVSWVAMPNAWGSGDRPVLLPFHGLYNVADQEGWFSVE